MMSQVPIQLSKVPQSDIDNEILRAGMIAELDAINLYEQMKAMAQRPKIKEILTDITKEEKTHLGEFESELIRLDTEQERELGAGAEEVMKMKSIPITSRRMNAWICYLKTCAKETNNTYLECVQDKARKQREYYPKKEYWEQEALKGCPRGI